jgi:signal transduction histidine kinase
MEARRQDTDDQLSNERIDTDEAVASLGETRSALVHSERERARRRYVLSMVTHDLRSPLCVIAVNAEVIAADAQNASLREAAEEVTRAAARMERLLTDLLDVAGIESGTLSIVKRRHDVGALMTEVLRSYRPLFVDRDMTFVVDLPDAPLVASFDHDRIVQVLSNLLGNALKFMSPKGLARLRVEPGAQQLEFVLSDNGPGIRENALPHVFKQFWQIESDTRRGLGLGLYICEKIIQAHGGRIWAESVPGKGATFRFTLPAS